MILIMKKQRMASLSNRKRKKKVKIKGKEKSNLIFFNYLFMKYFFN